MLVRRWGGGGRRGNNIRLGRGLVRGRDIGRSWFGGGRRVRGKCFCLTDLLAVFHLICGWGGTCANS